MWGSASAMPTGIGRRSLIASQIALVEQPRHRRDRCSLNQPRIMTRVALLPSSLGRFPATTRVHKRANSGGSLKAPSAGSR